jgi:DNA-binding winged helix-turn-helix (wHTH) protein
MGSERSDEAAARAMFLTVHMDLGLTSPGASAVLHALLVRAGSAVSRVQLGDILSLSPSTISSYVCQLRLELQRLHLSAALETVRNQGYRIKQSAATQIVQRLHLNEIQSSNYHSLKRRGLEENDRSILERCLPDVKHVVYQR